MDITLSSTKELFLLIYKAWEDSRRPGKFWYANKYYLALRDGDNLTFKELERPDETATSFKR